MYPLTQQIMLDSRNLHTTNNFFKIHSLSKTVLHNLHFLKKGSFSPNLSNLAELLLSEWTLQCLHEV